MSSPDNGKKIMEEISLSEESQCSSRGKMEGKEPLESSQSLAVGDVDPFANSNSDNDIKWKNLSWWQCSAIMLAETISLGILSLPATLAVVGIIPGVLLILGLGMLATYTGYVYGQFRNRHPSVTGIGDAFQILFSPLGPRWGKFGRGLGDIGQLLFMLFLMASHILTFVIAFETILGRICSIWWGVIAMVLFLVLGLPRTLKCMSYMSIFSAASVTIAVGITMIALGVSKPSTGLNGTNPYHLWPVNPPPFYKVFISVTNIVFAYAGHAAFFTFITELKDPRDFPKSLALLQTVDISLYALSACVIYVFAGAGVKSPALSSTSHRVQMAAWIVALPTVVIAGVIYGHVISKDLYLRIFKGTKHMTEKTAKGNAAWVGIIVTIWATAFILSESIPDFSNMLGLIASLFGSWFTYGTPGFFWLFMNRGKYTLNWKKMLLTCLNAFLVIVGAAIFSIGVFSSSYSMHVSTTKCYWSCKKGTGAH